MSSSSSTFSLRLLPLPLLILIAGAFALVEPEAGLWLILALCGMATLTVALGSPWLCAQGLMLTLFTGILTAVPIGFTLKAPQALTLLGLAAWVLQCLRQRQVPVFPWHWALPFTVCLLSFLPSFWAVDRSALSLGEAESSLRLLINYAWLQLLTLLILLEARTPQRIWRLLMLALASLAASLVFGLGQQAGFYLGVYDPFAYVGQHGSIVDFYGPFLRLSPGTFANEYGEILQTGGMLLVGLAFLIPGQQRWRWWGPLAAVMAALVINFTRASWLVFAVGAFVLLVAAGLRLRALLTVAFLGGAVLALLLWLSQILLAASLLLSVGQRFGELGQVQSHSAGQRLETWQMAWQAFLEAPWFGNGWGQFTQTHNVPLQLLAEVGIIGLLGFYGLMVWCVAVMFGAWRRASDPALKGLQLTLLMALLGCLAFDLTNHGIYHFVLWFCIGLGLALARCQEPQEAREKAASPAPDPLK
ncbi:MAG: O-antigen ligase family protein [Candidatus Sericytochromatia bacterium]